MPGLLPDSINDMVKSTLPDLGKGMLTEIAEELQDYTALSIFFKPDMMEKKKGRKIQWPVMVEDNENTENHGLYHQFTVSQHDGTQTAEVQWTWTTYKWTWDENEILMNRDPAQIFDYLESKKRAAFLGFCKKSEQNIWRMPSAADNTAPKGIPYWVTKNATQGFNGGIPTGFSDVAGLSPTTYSGWNNYTGLFTDVIETDFVDLLTDAIRLTGFKSPAAKSSRPKEHGDNAPDRRRFFTNNSMLGKMEQLARANNDSLGANITAYMGGVLVNRREVDYVPQLDEDTTDPFYGIHTGTMKVAYIPDRWMTSIKIERLPLQPSSGIVYDQSGWNLICYNRRRSFVLATAASYPS